MVVVLVFRLTVRLQDLAAALVSPELSALAVLALHLLAFSIVAFELAAALLFSGMHLAILAHTLAGRGREALLTDVAIAVLQITLEVLLSVSEAIGHVLLNSGKVIVHLPHGILHVSKSSLETIIGFCAESI